MKKFRKESRLVRKILELENQHKGNEVNYNYYGGYSMGYIVGKLEGLVEGMSDEDFNEFCKIEKAIKETK